MKGNVKAISKVETIEMDMLTFKDLLVNRNFAKY